MTRFTKRFKLALIPAVILTAGSAMAGNMQAWHVEAKGFANQQAADLVIDVDNGKYWAAPADMESLGFDLTKLPTTNGKIELSSAGKLTVNELDQSIVIDVRTDLLPESVFDFRSGFQYMAPRQPIDGSFLNYDIRAESNEKTSATGLFDFNTFIFGDIRANFQGLLRAGDIGNQRRTERLLANLSHDDATSALTWTLGDAQSASGQDVNPVSFTGVQIKKNFSLQPGFLSQPSFELKGAAAAPSIVDVFIDNRKIMSGNLPSGPFSLKNLTALSGSSNARIVVRDIFGQEQVISQQLLGGPQLLKKGLSSYAFQSGAMRNGYSSTDGQFVSGYYRYGFTDFFTAEVNAERSYRGVELPDVRHTGGTVVVSTPLGDMGLSARNGDGSIVTKSYQNSISGNKWTAVLNANFTRSSLDYHILGNPLPSDQTRRTIQASFQTDIGISASVFDVQTPTSASTGLTFNYSPRRPFATSYSLTFNKNRFGAGEPVSVFLNANIPFDSMASNRISSSAMRFSRDSAGKFGPAFDYSDSPQTSYGNSYRFHQEGYGSTLRLDADISRKTFASEMALAASHTHTGTGYRGSIRGAVVQHDGNHVATRWIDGGYAVVDAGAPNVKVNVDGQAQGSSNKDGMAIVPITMPYTKVRINLDSETVPDNYDNNPEVVATYRAGGAKVQFRGVTSTMVRIAGIIDGHIVVNGKPYPITDRGFFVELSEGSYTGKTDKDKTVHFTVPKSSRTGLTYVQGVLE